MSRLILRGKYSAEESEKRGENGGLAGVREVENIPVLEHGSYFSVSSPFFI